MSSLFGTRRQGNGGHSHGSGQKCCNNHGPPGAAMPAYPAGGALGQAHDNNNSSGGDARVVQPGMEMMPTLSQVPGGLAGLPLGDDGLAGGGGGGGLMGVGDIEESLKGVPPDVLAAAERLSLISPMMLGGGVGGVGADGVVRTAPGAEATDTGELSVSHPALPLPLLMSTRNRDVRAVQR